MNVRSFVNPLCFACSLLMVLLIVFLIVRIKFAPKTSRSISTNRLTLTPYYICSVYLLFVCAECLFINWIPDPSERLNLCF